MRPGEARKVAWVALIGAAYAAATSLGEDIAQAIFVARAGAEALPRMFLFKGALDVAAAAAYLPLTRGRDAYAVWRIGTAIYVASVGLGWLWAESSDVAGAYGLYVVHESAWTILTIHWAVVILEFFDANQARRLFPILFAATRMGGIAAGAVLGGMARSSGALDLLLVCMALGGLAGLLTFGGKGSGRKAPVQPTAPSGWRGASRAATGSPMVRAIAYSTAAMVLVRYGLDMVSLFEINQAYRHDEDLVAEFLGEFRVWANAISAVLGIFVIPRLLSWVGVGAINLVYAVATLAAYAGLLLAPSLTTAALARFVRQQFKDATKTPLSALFYGAEPAHLRSAARAFMFGAIIPAATAVTAITFELSSERGELELVAIIGAALAAVFVGLSHLLNVRWRRRIVARLHEELAAPGVEEAIDQKLLADLRSRLPDQLDGDAGTTVDAALRAMASSEPGLPGLGEEVLAETISRRRAHLLAHEIPRPR